MATQLNKWILHFSADPYRGIPHSRHHFIKQFYKKGFGVIWVNPIGLRFPSAKKSGFRNKIIRKIKSTLRLFQREGDRFYILNPVFLPVYTLGKAERINCFLISLQVKILLFFLQVKTIECLTTLPTFGPVVRKLKQDSVINKLIYYYSDQYDKYREIKDPEPILYWDNMLREDASAIYCASEKILNSIPQEMFNNKVVKIIEHQVDFDLFDYKKITPQSLGFQGPVIGYYGSITDSNDWDMIEPVAKRNPQWQFVFIGEKKIKLTSLITLPNVHFLGFIDYEILPSIAVNFDIGLMIWKLTDWIKACSPLKFKEYLSLGLPVISVPIDEIINKYSDYVEIVTNSDELENAIKKQLMVDRKEKHRGFAEGFSWGKAVDKMIDDLKLSGDL